MRLLPCIRMDFINGPGSSAQTETGAAAPCRISQRRRISTQNFGRGQRAESLVLLTPLRQTTNAFRSPFHSHQRPPAHTESFIKGAVKIEKVYRQTHWK